MLDTNHLIGEIAQRHGIRVEEGDPIFAVTTINKLMLEEAAESLIGRMRVAISEFEQSARTLDKRSGEILAAQVRQSANAIRGEIQGDIRSASLQASKLLKQIHEARSRGFMLRWIAVGLLAGSVLFGCGVWVGTLIQLRP